MKKTSSPSRRTKPTPTPMACCLFFSLSLLVLLCCVLNARGDASSDSSSGSSWEYEDVGSSSGSISSGYWSSEDGSEEAEVVFGHEMLKYFYMQDGYVNLNHGSFGTSCRLAAEAEHAYWLQMESNPNTWFRGVYQKYLLGTRLLVSSFIFISIVFNLHPHLHLIFVSISFHFDWDLPFARFC